MKKLLFFFLFLSSTNVYCQKFHCDNYTLNFEDTFCIDQLFIDTISNSNNIWKVGIPSKDIFNSSFSLPFAIVTDTVNYYPINDTSSFIISNQAWEGYANPHTAILSGYYMCNTDTLNDYGMIEVSPDNGNTWIDILKDTIYEEYIWIWEKPILSGNILDWKAFYIHLDRLGLVFDIDIGDTIKYKFTFISDSIYDAKEGLMFDDLHFEDWAETINELKISKPIIYPNPSNDIIFIKYNGNIKTEICSILGMKLLKTDSKIINVSEVKKGIYLLKIYNNSGALITTEKIVIVR